MKCGIYKITNVVNNMCYIGSSNQIERRFSQHKGKLKKKKHENMHLQNAWNQFGESNFKFEILEECCIENLLDREQYYLNTILHADSFKEDSGQLFYSLGYNLNPICDRPYISDVQKEKISATLKEKYRTGGVKKIGEKKVYQYNRYTGELIKVWKSVNDANRYYSTPNLTTTQIQRCLWGKQISAFDSVWSYSKISFIWASIKTNRKSIYVCVLDTKSNTYSFYDNISAFLKVENPSLKRSDSHTLRKKYLNSETKLFKKRYKIFEVAPIIYDGKPFELLGTREDKITKTKEEILNANV